MLKTYSKKTIPRVEQAIRAIFPPIITKKKFKELLGEPAYRFDYRAWKEIVGHPLYELFNRGGKRLRPLLMCLAHDALGGSHPLLYRLAAIPELMHSGTLMIDDIEDGSKLRRGKPAIHELFGVPVTINHANLLYFLPTLLINKSNLTDAIKTALYQTIAGEMAKLHLGQGLDILWSSKKNYAISIDEYCQMTAFKTGALLAIAMKMGAILAGASARTVSALEKIATNYGIAFQIQDDILNLRPKADWGKQYGEDITEGKITFMVITTLTKANKKDQKKLRALLTAHTTNRTKITQAIALMDKYDTFTKAAYFSSRLVSEAQNTITKLFPPSPYRDMLVEIGNFLITRSR